MKKVEMELLKWKTRLIMVILFYQINLRSNRQPATNQKASPQSANEVVDILFPKNDSSLQSVKGSPSNPKKVELPRYSKERICPWNKYHGSI